MNKFAFATAIVGGMVAGVIGLAAPAQANPAPAASETISAGVDHLNWLDQIQPKPNVPKVDTTVRHSGR